LKRLAPVFGTGAHDRYPRPEPHQPPDKVAADEPIATGNQNATPEGL
jgi:hypothetical protein